MRVGSFEGRRGDWISSAVFGRPCDGRFGKGRVEESGEVGRGGGKQGGVRPELEGRSRGAGEDEPQVVGGLRAEENCVRGWLALPPQPSHKGPGTDRPEHRSAWSIVSTNLGGGFTAAGGASLSAAPLLLAASVPWAAARNKRSVEGGERRTCLRLPNSLGRGQSDWTTRTFRRGEAWDGNR